MTCKLVRRVKRASWCMRCINRLAKHPFTTGHQCQETGWPAEYNLTPSPNTLFNVDVNLATWRIPALHWAWSGHHHTHFKKEKKKKKGRNGQAQRGCAGRVVWLAKAAQRQKLFAVFDADGSQLARRLDSLRCAHAHLSIILSMKTLILRRQLSWTPSFNHSLA